MILIFFVVKGSRKYKINRTIKLYKINKMTQIKKIIKKKKKKYYYRKRIPV